MSTTKRLSKLQRCRYLNIDNYLSGELCFWNDGLHDPAKYELVNQRLISECTNIKENSITQKK